MNEQQKIKEELIAQDAPLLLARQGKVPKWELPPAYLEQLADRALSTTTTEPNSIYRRLRMVRPWVIAAAVVVLLVGTGYWWLSTITTQPTDQLAEINLNTVPLDDLEQYISDHIEDFELELLATGIQEISDNAPSVPLAPEIEISTEALEEFLETDEGWLDELEEEEWF